MEDILRNILRIPIPVNYAIQAPIKIVSKVLNSSSSPQPVPPRVRRRRHHKTHLSQLGASTLAKVWDGPTEDPLTVPEQKVTP